MRAVALLLLVAACGGREPPRGGAGNDRIVSLLPSFTEILVGLEAADRIVGCTAWCRPGREVTRVAWEDVGAAEAILRLRPDLVLKQDPRRSEDPLRAVLERAGVRVVALPSETMADVRAAITGIGEAVGRADAAAAFLARFDADLEDARRGAGGLAKPGVLFVFGRDPGRAANVTAAGPGSFLDELIRFAGGRNVLADVDAPYPAVGLEAIVRRAPDVIIDNLPPEEDFRAAWAALETVPAVRDGRLFAVRDPDLLIPGPHLPQAVARLVEMIHGRP